MESSPPTITIQVKFTGRPISMEVPAAATTAELKRLLQPLTNVLLRGQRLVCKGTDPQTLITYLLGAPIISGKVLQDAASLSSMQVVDRSKVMLIASQGLHQGDGPITKNSSSSATSVARTSNVKERQTQKPEAVVGKSRAERWKLTGVVALHDCDLKAVPEEVWDCGPSVRILDASNNCIKEIPHKISALKSLNCCFDLATELKLKFMVNVTFDSFSLVGRIATLPLSIGDCESLTEVDFSANLLTELPEAFGKLYNLKVLHLRNNGLTSLPSTLFKKCMQLITLDLHGTEITNDILRQVEGWEEFDERRQQKHQKQLDFRVGSSGVFDEGADDDNRRR
ncbi:plant intracellular Ras-group-related LRR protein 8 [Panicum miliaceum]|uniref:Plant intracellular Ras-group-related LRR protein 8 n=1 Tax=Panicum miliaceum TaxID=4540 RepID=A0A3L6S6I0_PANMI|nr:plant intracellular Ras-group-related LRR protein 8 [Panicum miliaceum]